MPCSRALCAAVSENAESKRIRHTQLEARHATAVSERTLACALVFFDEARGMENRGIGIISPYPPVARGKSPSHVQSAGRHHGQPHNEIIAIWTCDCKFRTMWHA
jgi:hypothetical protein